MAKTPIQLENKKVKRQTKDTMHQNFDYIMYM